MALLQQQRRKCVPRRVHPRPRFGVGQIAVPAYGFPQMVVAEVVVASVILEFTIQHFLTDGEHGEYRVAEEATIGRNPIEAFVEQNAAGAPGSGDVVLADLRFSTRNSV